MAFKIEEILPKDVPVPDSVPTDALSVARSRPRPAFVLLFKAGSADSIGRLRVAQPLRVFGCAARLGDAARLQPQVIWAFLHRESGWAQGIPYEVVCRTLEHSLNFGLCALLC